MAEYSLQLMKALRFAKAEAAKRNLQNYDTVYLLFAFLGFPNFALHLLKHCGVNLELFRRSIEEHLGPVVQDATVLEQILPSFKAEIVLNNAEKQATEFPGQNGAFVDCPHVLLELLKYSKTTAQEILWQHGVTIPAVLSHWTKNFPSPPPVLSQSV